jgi:hypothetical protein
VSLRDRTAIVGVGTTAYGTRGQFFGRSQLEQIREALDLALDESGIDRREIDGFASYSVDANDPARLAPGLGIPNVNVANMVLGGGGGGTCGAIANAAAAIVAGLAKIDGLQGHHAAAARARRVRARRRRPIRTPTSTSRSGSSRRRSSSR